MEKRTLDLLSNLNSMASRAKLFLAAFKYIGSNVWFSFYHYPDDNLITIADVVLFDTAEEGFRGEEIYNPTVLLRVLEVYVSEKGIYGRKTAIVKLMQPDGILEYK